MWSYVDFGIIILEVLILKSLWFDVTSREALIELRIEEAFLILLMGIKSLYFLKLKGEFEPIIDILFKTIKYAKSMVIIFIIGVLAFSHTFYLMGNNQLSIANKYDSKIEGFENVQIAQPLSNLWYKYRVDIPASCHELTI